MKLKEFTNKSQLPNPIYKIKPYVVLNKDGMILSAGTFQEVKNLLVVWGDYYADCRVNIRQYDLYMNDNTKIE